ncbi:MAG TPA: hypothetical protein VIJ75_10470 [Hanamia sp.]
MLFTSISLAFVAAVIAIFIFRSLRKKKNEKININEKEYEEKKGIID